MYPTKGSNNKNMAESVLAIVTTCSFNQPFLRAVHKTGSHSV
jgi:hypothetical protein